MREKVRFRKKMNREKEGKGRGRGGVRGKRGRKVYRTAYVKRGDIGTEGKERRRGG